MKMPLVVQKANEFGIKVIGKSKKDLILAIQMAEGNIACFGTSNGTCDQIVCCWREDCIPSEPETKKSAATKKSAKAKR